MYEERTRLKRKTSKKLYDKYSETFAFLERVVNSCETLPQLYNASEWAIKCLWKIESEECKNKCIDKELAINHYMVFRVQLIKSIIDVREKKILDAMEKKEDDSGNC